ncbi:cytidine deaminase [Candidatus Sumerlaeota bacterium]
MVNEQTQLIEAAKAVCRELELSDEFSSGSVGAAIFTAAGSVYTGVCIDLSCGLGFCAEAAAVAEMLKHRESQIAAVVAVCQSGRILAPCGRCREMMAQVNPANLDAQVILEGERTLPLRALLPENGIEKEERSRDNLCPTS